MRDIDPNTPVLVGVGLIMQREDDPLKAREPLALMIDAALAAGVDAGADEALSGVERILVPVGRWRYRNPGKLIGEAIGAENAMPVSALPGVSQQTLISDACTQIARGEVSKALVVGGEAGHRLLRARIQGVEVQDTESTDLADIVLKPEDEMLPDYEKKTGLGQMPVGYYAIIDSALRFARGRGIEDHRDDLASLYSRFSTIAAENPHAWSPRAVDPAVIRTHSEKNSMVAFPYTKLHNAQWNVDQASALLFCSAAEAARLGIAREKWVFPQVFTEANHMVNLTARHDLHRCLGAEAAGKAAFEAAGKTPDDLDFLELYSCFPVAVESYAYEVGVPDTIDWTFTGAMPFAGGPFNSFVLHATAQLADHIRRKPGSLGMVTTVSGVLTKQGFALWGADPNPNGYQFIDVTDQVAQAARPRGVVPDYQGPAVIAGYTVIYERKKPHRGVAVVDLPGGQRSIAATEDAKLMAAMEREEFCGRQVTLADGHFVPVC